MGWQTALKRWVRKWCLCILLTVVLAAAYALLKWCQHNQAADIREAVAAGFQWQERQDPFDAMSEDWHNAFRKETWTSHRRLDLGEVPDLTPYRSLIHRLDPTILTADGCKNVDALEGLTALQVLWLHYCPGLQNVDGIKGLTALQGLRLANYPGLRNVDGLKGLTALKELYLRGCPGIPAAALRELAAALPNATIRFPDGTLTPPP